MKKKPVELAYLLGLAWLYMPIALFLIFWIRWFIAIPVLILSIIAIVLFFRKHKIAPVKITKKFAIFAVISLVIITAWCAVCGVGGFFEQAYDWKKHNVLLSSMSEKPWPVRYDFGSDQGVLSYYIGGYLVPAFFGKFLGFGAAQVVMLIWFSLGLFIAMLIIYKLFGKNKPVSMLLIVTSMVLFATFMSPLAGIYRYWFPDEVGTMGIAGVGSHWFSEDLRVQYSANSISMSFVAPQIVASFVAVALFLSRRKQYGSWILIAAPLILHSTFVFLGMGMVMAFAFLFDSVSAKGKRKELWKSIITLRNITAAIIAVILVGYIACNLLQPKPESAKMGLELLNYGRHKWAFIFIHASWIIWMLLLWRKERKNTTLLSAAICLAIFPFMIMGMYNDLCMRASLPALNIFCFIVAKNLIEEWKRDKFYTHVLLGCLIFVSLSSFGEVMTRVKHTFEGEVPDYKNIDSAVFLQSEDYVKYQYIDWSNSKLSKFLLQD